MSDKIGAKACENIAFEYFAEGAIFQAIDWLMKGKDAALEPEYAYQLEAYASEIGDNPDFQYKAGDADFAGTFKRLGLKL